MNFEVENYDFCTREKYIAPTAVRWTSKKRESINFVDVVRTALRLALANLPATMMWGAICGTRIGSLSAVKSGFVSAFVAKEVAETFKKYYSRDPEGTLQEAFFHNHPREHFPTVRDCEKFGFSRADFLTAPSDGMLVHSSIDSTGFTRPLGIEMSIREIYKLNLNKFDHCDFFEKMLGGKMLVFILKPRHKHAVSVPAKCAFKSGEFAHRELDPARFWKLIRTTDPAGSKKMSTFCGKKHNPHLRNPRTVTELSLENFELRSGVRAKIYLTMLAAVGVRPIVFEKKMDVPQSFEFGESFAKFKIGSTVVLGIPREVATTIHFNESLLSAKFADADTMFDLLEGTILGWNFTADEKLRNLSNSEKVQISTGVRIGYAGGEFKFFRAKDQR